MRVQQERAAVARDVGRFAALAKALSDAAELRELAEADAEIAAELAASLATAQTSIEQLELQRLLGKKTMENEILREAVTRAAGPKKLLLRSSSWPEGAL